MAIRNRGYTNQVLAIRNRVYTNQVRLRGLKEFETHGGGFCLYSKRVFITQTKLWRLEIAATQTKSAFADSKNLKPTEVGFVCIAANSIRQGKRVFTAISNRPIQLYLQE